MRITRRNGRYSAYLRGAVQHFSIRVVSLGFAPIRETPIGDFISNLASDTSRRSVP